MSEKLSILVIDHPWRPSARAVAEYFFDAKVELEHSDALLDEDGTVVATIGGRIVLAVPEWPAALVEGTDDDLANMMAVASEGRGRAGAFVMHGGVGWYGFALWDDGELVRRREGDTDDPLRGAYGAELPSETLGPEAAETLGFAPVLCALLGITNGPPGAYYMAIIGSVAQSIRCLPDTRAPFAPWPIRRNS
jgi:hypothetical protein